MTSAYPELEARFRRLGVVHGRGSLLSTAELVEAATGAPLGTTAFERHLRERYLA